MPEISQLTTLGEFVKLRQVSGICVQAARHRSLLPEAELFCCLQKLFRAKFLPKLNKISVAAFFQCTRKIHGAMCDAARAAEDLPVHYNSTGTLVFRQDVFFQRRSSQHRFEYRADRIAFQRPVQKRAARFIQAGSDILRIISRHTDACADRCSCGVQHQHTSACHHFCRNRFRCPLYRAGDGQLHACCTAVLLCKNHCCPGAQSALRGNAAGNGIVCARTGQNGIQRFFQPGCTVTVIAQIADQVLAQRRFQISPDRRITLCPLYRKILTYLQQKRCGAVAVPVQKSLPGTVGDAVEPGIVALTRKAER